MPTPPPANSLSSGTCFTPLSILLTAGLLWCLFFSTSTKTKMLLSPDKLTLGTSCCTFPLFLSRTFPVIPLFQGHHIQKFGELYFPNARQAPVSLIKGLGRRENPLDGQRLPSPCTLCTWMHFFLCCPSPSVFPCTSVLLHCLLSTSSSEAPLSKSASLTHPSWVQYLDSNNDACLYQLKSHFFITPVEEYKVYTFKYIEILFFSMCDLDPSYKL